eukprot:TRINITY_DN30574_c0_g1_i1.p1 TRINITY_DN30574_c0_g1~~TRINITY_DN30574_c0_g1_i1.p1  ORF type:complete len:310 (-),score=47.04 TRINITY_DN30574_c0_g1_i1:225-1127(-)
MAKRTGLAIAGKFVTSKASSAKRGSASVRAPRAAVAKGKKAEVATKSRRSPTRGFPTVGRLSRVLTFGCKRRPTSIVIMLHGLNDSSECCAEGVVEKWAEGLKGALVVVPQSPDQSIWSDSSDKGYDWLRQNGTHDTFDDEANVRELQRVVRLRLLHLTKWTKDLLAKYHLGPDRLIITGFSQGSILAALVAAHLGALGAVVCGGVTGQPVYSAEADDYVGGGWMRWEELLPKATTTKRTTKFCAVNGTADPYVPRRQVENMLSPFECHWHWEKGVGHDFPDRWYRVALQWMKGLLDADS